MTEVKGRNFEDYNIMQRFIYFLSYLNLVINEKTTILYHPQFILEGWRLFFSGLGDEKVS